MLSRLPVYATAAAVALPVFGASFAEAGTIRHDRDDSLYTNLAGQSQYDPVGALLWTTGSGTFLGSGNLIGSRWVLTVAHVGLADPNTTAINFTFGNPNDEEGIFYSAIEWIAHPNWSGDLSQGWDIGLVRLAEPVADVIPASRYTPADEQGRVGTFVGFGQTGNGLTGATQPSGTKRAGTNIIDVFGGAEGAGLDEYSFRIMFSDFDHPGDPSASRWGSSTPTNLEYMAAPGDSGGGVYFAAGPETRLAGLMSFVLNTQATNVGTYGDALGSIRVSQFNQWIDDTIANYWNSSLSGGFSTTGNWSFNEVPEIGDITGLRDSGIYTITFDSNVTNERLLARGGNVTMNLAGRTYTLTSPAYEGALVVGKYAGETAAVTFTGGTVNSSGTIIAELAGSNGTVRISSGTWNNSGNVHVGGGTLASGGAGTLHINGGNASIADTLKVWNAGSAVNYSAGNLSAGRIELVNGGRMNLTAGGDKTLHAGTLSIASASGSRIDLADNQMRITGESLATVTDFVRTGFNNGNWLGNGITSSTAASQIGRALGIAPDGSDVLVRFTWGGDATLDGAVSIADLGVLSANWQQSNRFWHQGDFNYDGSVSIADLGILAANWQKGTAGSSVSFEEAMAMFDVFDGIVIPEPAALSLLGLGGLLALRRQRRGGSSK